MTNREILTKAIQRAIDGGWFETTGLNGYTIWSPVGTFDSLIILEEKETHEKRQYNYQAVIFNRDFAKALWPPAELEGLGTIINDNADSSYAGVKRVKMYVPPVAPVLDLALQTYLERWQRHLVLMVLAEDPIKYLGEHL